MQILEFVMQSVAWKRVPISGHGGVDRAAGSRREGIGENKRATAPEWKIWRETSGDGAS